MREHVELAFSMGAGMLLGTVFFAGLAFTVKHGVGAARPAVWFPASLLLRTGVVLGGLYLAAGGDWRRLLAGLAGFLMMRTALIRRALRARAERPTRPAVTLP